MKRKILFGFASLMMLALLAGCGKVPQEQIDSANLAIESAKAAEADVYAPTEYAALQNDMNAIMTSIEAENSKTFKNFKEQTTQLTNLTVTADQVKANAAVAKEQVGVEVQELFTVINNLIAENKDLMTKAPKGKEGAAVLEEIRNEMVVIEGAVAEANTLYAEGKYMAARDKVNAAIENVTAINAELNDAIAKVKRK
ncbi:MAG: hypothetical protein IH597_03210 [Bacteroidales bacterium]|nr:hypothetical protein [Bacteroidales bacterium]